MRIYFAGSIFPEIFKHEPRHVLTTFNNQYEAKKACANAEKWGFELILDSGAFSAWNSGRTIDREQYLKFILQMKARHPKAKIYPVNLDVIPGKQGEKITQEQVDISAAKGWENYEYFKSHGVETIHVFHEGENLNWLRRMIKEVDYIGVSPCNDSSLPRKVEFCKKAFHEIPEGKKVHGFAVTSKRLMTTFPWYSVDSASWAIGAGLGNIWTKQFGQLYFGGRKKGEEIFMEQRAISEIAIDLLDKELSQYPLEWPNPQNKIADLQTYNRLRRMVNFFYLKNLEDEYNANENKCKKYINPQFELFPAER